MTDQKLTLTVGEAAQLLGISRGLAYEAVHRGELPTIKVGRRLLVPRAALEKMLEGSPEGKKNPPAPVGGAESARRKEA